MTIIIVLLALIFLAVLFPKQVGAFEDKGNKPHFLKNGQVW